VQKKTNQEHNRKKTVAPASLNQDQPSKAPRQDEGDREYMGSARYEPHHVDDRSDEQGISNRPVKEEHAFPESDVPPAEPDRASVDTTPKQTGGNRGGV
jgi:hypothetical protein